MSDASSNGLELIAFRIGEQDFCVNIMAVREIRGWSPATPLPQAPDYVRGVINLRGAVLPIIDLSARIGLGEVAPSARHVIIVAQIGNRMVGLLVDAVSDILTVSPDDIKPTPQVGSERVQAFLRGILADNGRMISVVDLEQILPVSERAAA